MQKKKTKVIVIVVIVLIIFIAIISSFCTVNLDNRQYALLGDSIMSGYGNDDKSIDYYFREELPDATFINLAQGGATISDSSPEDKKISSQIDKITGYPEYILIDGGANDIIDYEIGFLTKDLEEPIGEVDLDNGKTVTSGTSVISDFEKIVSKLKEKYPDSKIIYIEMFLIDDTTIDNITLDESKKPTIRARRDQLFEQIKIACEKWDVYYIDVSEKFIDTGIMYRQSDWIHLNETGYRRLVPYLLQEIKNANL